jgi:dihydroorotase
MRVLIKNGKLLDPSSKLDQTQDLFIAGNKIVSLNKKPDGFNPDLVINAKDKIVLPGLIDLCARLREPGSEKKGNFDSELFAANSSGITSVSMPPDTKPVIDTPAVVEFIHQRARETNRANIYPLGALTHQLEGEQLAEMYLLKEAGCIGVSNALSTIKNTEVLRRAFEYAKSCDLTVFIYAEDEKISNNGVAHEGAISTRLGLPAIPETAETIAISRALLLIEQTNVRAHFCHLSSARAVDLIRTAKKNGINVTTDASICNLHLTDMDIADYDSNCHLKPPLRSERDRVGLIEGICDETISAVCSDHQPHEVNAKSAPFSITESGASTIEHLLPLMLHLVNRKEIKLNRAISALTSEPAKILGIDKGVIEKNKNADLCIYAPNSNINVDKNHLLSSGKNTPFNGWELQGKVTHTLLNGKVVFSID